MPPAPSLTMPLHNPLAFLDATVLFVIQLLIAQHPELLHAPEEHHEAPLRPQSHAALLLTAVRELHYALDIYRACLPPQHSVGDNHDAFPF